MTVLVSLVGGPLDGRLVSLDVLDAEVSVFVSWASGEGVPMAYRRRWTPRGWYAEFVETRR